MEVHTPTTSSPAFLPSHIIKRRRHLQLPGLPPPRPRPRPHPWLQPLAQADRVELSPNAVRSALLAESGDSNPRLWLVVGHGGLPLSLQHRGFDYAGGVLM
ncbi:uncharacterized protein J3R85_012595 [Psidium guajava]|nr:uncharacterized protein J3R85_012595 [Psidium guajava]